MKELGEILTTNFSDSQRIYHLLPCYSKDTNCIWRARNTTWEIQGCACEKEAPFIELLADLCKFIQIEHLSNRHPKECNQIIVQP
jgi:hypothetical protein